MLAGVVGGGGGVEGGGGEGVVFETFCPRAPARRLA